MVMLRRYTLKIIFMAALLAGFVFSSTIQAQTSLAQEHFERAVGYHLSGNNEAAIKAFRESLLYNKKDATTHFYMSLVYDVMHMGVNAIKHMLKAEKYFEAEGRDYWKDRSRQGVEDYYHLYKYEKEDFEK
jgi:Tfp pilus assembly protein PilF